MARQDARRLNPAYRPALSREHLEALADFADGTEQFETGYADRPLRDLRALEFFPSITHVGISHAEVTDFSPLARLPNLVRLSISEPTLNALHVTRGPGAMRSDGAPGTVFPPGPRIHGSICGRWRAGRRCENSIMRGTSWRWPRRWPCPRWRWRSWRRSIA